MKLTIRIKELREARDLTQQQLADMVGVSKAHISGVESGKKNLNNHLLERISDALKVEPYELILPERHQKLIALARELQALRGPDLDDAHSEVQRLSRSVDGPTL